MLTPANVTVLLGPARCGKTHALVDEYYQALRSIPTGGGNARATWLAPNSRAAADIRGRLIAAGLRVCLEPGVTTFDAFARDVLAAADAPPRQLGPMLERTLLRRVVRRSLDERRLVVLADAARRDSFLKLIAEHFGELARHGIRPRDFAAKKIPRGNQAQHEELAQLYLDYGQLLADHNLCDAESRLQRACERLAGEEGSESLQHLELVVVDGFSDFSAVQLDLIGELARRTKRLLIALPGESPLLPPGTGQDDDSPWRGEGASAPGRADLFAKTIATLAELKHRHPRLEVRSMPPRASTWPAMDHFERNLFQHPRKMAAPSQATIDSLDRLEVVQTAGRQHEIVEIARIIKRRLLDGRDRPGDIVVVFRQLHDAAPRVRAVFTEFGIPFSLESALPLAASGLLRTLLDLLRLDEEDWPFRRVVSMVTNNLLTAFHRTDRAATEWLVRNLQVAARRADLFTRIERLAGEAAAATGASQTNEFPRTYHDRQTRAAGVVLRFLERLATALDALPEKASPTAWTAALAQLGETLGIEAFTASSDADPFVADDRLAWQQVVNHFASLERLAAWLGEEPPQLSRKEALHALVDLVDNERFPRPHDDVGRVRVLSAATARTVEAKHLVLAGMSEQAFPAPERAGRLYDDADYEAFARAVHQRRADPDAPLPRRPQEEMLLFYEIVTRATERLTISYPALDEKAQALPPSPYVTELEHTLGELLFRRRGVVCPSPLPPDEAPLSVAEWRVGAVAKAVLRNPPELASLARLHTEPTTATVANSLDAALRGIASRANSNRFGPEEGILASDAVRQRLAKRFGKAHLWSPSQFEKYARCPFLFLLEDVLALEPIGELVLEDDPRRRGTMLHRALATIHRERAELFTASRLAADAIERFEVEFANVVDALHRATPHHGVAAAMAELDRRRIAEWAPKYFAQHTDYRDAKWPALDEPLAPTHFEWRFGPPRFEEADHEDSQSTSTPFELDLSQEKIRITGRIDRIDVGRVGEMAVFNVIDYKSGKRPTLSEEKMRSGERLQPAIYVMAAQALLFEGDQSTPLWAGYWSMSDGPTTKKGFGLHCSDDGQSISDDWRSLQNDVVARVAEIVADIRAGQFPVYSRDEHCTNYCDFRTTCRIAQVRSLQKTWPPIV